MKNYSMLELAFMGDAVHTAFVRKNILESNSAKMNDIHKICSKFCSAKWQSEILEKLNLNEEEENIARMARNTKTKHSAKNSCPADYHKATAFEALVGWHYFNNNEKRLNEILQQSIKQGEEECL